MPTYPELPNLPGPGLVPPERQPTYLDLPGVDLPEEVNLCQEMVDRFVLEGRGDRPAVVFWDEGTTITYAGLLEQVAAFAGGLRDRGLEVGDRVGIRYRNRPEAIVAMLAVWRLGGAVLPVPAQARAAELPDYLVDVGARFLITDPAPASVAEVVSAGDSLGVEEVIVGPGAEPGVGLRWEDVVAASAGPAEPVLIPADLPSVFWHTGGTTGKPKGCYHTARQYLLAGRSVGMAFAVDPDRDVHLALPGPVGHAAGMIGRTNVSLLNGVPYVEVEAFNDPKAVLKAMSDCGVTWVMAVAMTWAKMLEVLERDPSAYDLSKLDKAYASMLSVVSDDVPAGWAERGHPLQNLMGSTQFATWFVVSPPGAGMAPRCVGLPAPGYEAIVVDAARGADLVEVDRGELGLLAVRGPSGLTYWNRPELQARDVRGGWTVMDDLATMAEDGTIWYEGRSDFLINTAGYKVTPVEVEEALGRHPAVSEVSVVGSPDPERGEAVTAFVVLDEAVSPSEELVRELQAFVRSSISPYKYPRRVVFARTLPRDTVGKVKIRQLREQASKMTFTEGVNLAEDMS